MDLDKKLFIKILQKYQELNKQEVEQKLNRLTRILINKIIIPFKFKKSHKILHLILVRVIRKFNVYWEKIKLQSNITMIKSQQLYKLHVINKVWFILNSYNAIIFQ